MRVAIYIRISTDEENQPFSLEAQENKLRSYISSQDDWHVVQIYSEQASGSATERPQLNKLLAAARAGRFDLVLVYRVDRFSRSVRGLAQLMDELDSAGVVFRSATEPFDTSDPAGRMMVQMLAVFAEFERATLIDRVINGMERKAARGEWCGGARPYGYSIDPHTNKLIVKEDEAGLPPHIFQMYTHKRLGAKEIANQLNDQGHRTKTGKPWSRNSVLTVLRNRAYIGEVFFRGQYHSGAHPALVEENVFAAAQEILTARGDDRAKRAGNASDYLLSGCLTCPECHKNYLGHAAHGNKYRYRYYSCYSRLRYGKKTCSSQQFPADQLERAVLEALLETYQRTDLFEEAIAEVARRRSELAEHYRAELTSVETDLANTEAAIERYLAAFESGTMSESVCGSRVKELAGKAAQLRDRHGELARLCSQETEAAPTQEELAAMRDHIHHAVTNGSPPVVKNLVQSLVAEVRITGERTVQPVFRIPANDSMQAHDHQTQVRLLSGGVPPGGFEPPHTAPEAGWCHVVFLALTCGELPFSVSGAGRCSVHIPWWLGERFRHYGCCTRALPRAYPFFLCSPVVAASLPRAVRAVKDDA
ncbi:site-specific DNA recombinase [Haloactinospora alba]|uniref:Site-specific DNA recombinase n=1 Tax=Haloactinospora alba TaxID=405555 RepID=A0A543NLC1_9ACTN|nr:recombinase family protein [Haloactinospora alba]TQN32638.1 site-specific DNA recombinase [Haloactinospora alba]